MKTNQSRKDAVNKYGFEPVLGYVRVSTEGQSKDDKYGLEMQKQAIVKYCMENRYVVVKWYVDIDSGVKANRPAIMELLNDENTHKAKKVIAFKSDRISRETKMYFYFLYEMEKKGLKLECITEEFDTESEFANLYRSMMLFVAEQERKNILYRTSKGKEVKRMEGGYCGGKVPYGYKVNGKKELEINREEAWIVMYVFYRHEQGIGYNKIAKELMERDYTTRKGTEISSSTVRSILKNRRFYQGYTNHKELGEVKGKYPALLKNINYDDYPKDVAEKGSIIKVDVIRQFEQDYKLKEVKGYEAERMKNREHYLKYHKSKHPMDLSELGKYRRALRDTKTMPEVEVQEEVVDTNKLEAEIVKLMLNADSKEGE